MRFRTEYTARRSDITLDPEREMLLLGSCFSDNVGGRMRRSLWNAEVNPCGTLFNPVSIANSLRTAFGERGMSDFFEKEGVWLSWDFPSAFSSACRTDSLSRSEEALRRLERGVRRSQALVVTFGTSIVYELKEKPGAVVANCHRFPATTFVRRRLSVGETVDLWNRVIPMLRSVNPSLKIIFTVSPVRHVKEGFESNSRSKAVLLLAVEELCDKNEECVYFPAYEIVGDDLRDYRFFASDLVHPSEECVDYVWEKFKETFLDASGADLLERGEALSRRAAHRPLVPGTAESQLFEEKTAEVVALFLHDHPTMLNPCGSPLTENCNHR